MDKSVPNYVIASIDMIGAELDRIMWNINQEEYDNPLKNTGNVEGYVTNLFEIHAYDWDNDNQEYNFIYKGFSKPYKISWYKYFGRDMVANQIITPDECAYMLDDILTILGEYENIYLKNN